MAADEQSGTLTLTGTGEGVYEPATSVFTDSQVGTVVLTGTAIAATVLGGNQGLTGQLQASRAGHLVGATSGAPVGGRSRA